jgi:hypothetical protein
MLVYVKSFLPPSLSKPASALLDIHSKLFTLNQLKSSEQTLFTAFWDNRQDPEQLRQLLQGVRGEA